ERSLLDDVLDRHPEARGLTQVIPVELGKRLETPRQRHVSSRESARVKRAKKAYGRRRIESAWMEARWPDGAGLHQKPLASTRSQAVSSRAGASAPARRFGRPSSPRAHVEARIWRRRCCLLTP